MEWLSRPLVLTLPLVVLCLWTWWRAKTREDFRRADWLTGAAAFLLPSNLLMHAAAGSMSAWTPAKLDAWAFAADAYLGNPAFAVGRLLHSSPVLFATCLTAYDLLLTALFAAFALTVWFRPEEATHVAKTLMLVVFPLPLFYWLVPICGPSHAFPSFPQLPGPVKLAAMTISAAPNGMPSGHFVGALVFMWCLRHWLIGRVVGAAFVALTFLATLGLGEHYAVDLLMAVPYAGLVLWLGGRSMSGVGSHCTGRRDLRAACTSAG